MKTRLAEGNPSTALIYLLGLLALGVGGAAVGLSVFSIVGILAIPTWVLLGARITAEIDHDSDSWLDAWIKTVVIFVVVVVLGVFVPSYVVELKSVAELDSKFQDIIGTGVFSAALVFSLWAIYRAHEAKRI